MQRYIFAWILSLVMVSCSKQKPVPAPVSLSIVHAITGSNVVVTNFTGTKRIDYLKAQKIEYGSFNMSSRFSVTATSQPLGIYNYPDTTDKSKPLLDLTLELAGSSINTLFLTGTKDHPDHILVKENLPDYGADSTMGVRFVNLSSGSSPVSVNIAGKPAGSELTGLSYKNITGFMRYDVKANMPDYVFECRDATTGTLIATIATEGLSFDGGDYNGNRWRRFNFTIALIGDPGATGVDAPRLFLIKHIPIPF